MSGLLPPVVQHCALRNGWRTGESPDGIPCIQGRKTNLGEWTLESSEYSSTWSLPTIQLPEFCFVYLHQQKLSFMATIGHLFGRKSPNEEPKGLAATSQGFLDPEYEDDEWKQLLYAPDLSSRYWHIWAGGVGVPFARRIIDSDIEMELGRWFAIKRSFDDDALMHFGVDEEGVEIATRMRLETDAEVDQFIELGCSLARSVQQALERLPR